MGYKAVTQAVVKVNGVEKIVEPNGLVPSKGNVVLVETAELIYIQGKENTRATVEAGTQLYKVVKKTPKKDK